MLLHHLNTMKNQSWLAQYIKTINWGDTIQGTDHTLVPPATTLSGKWKEVINLACTEANNDYEELFSDLNEPTWVPAPTPYPILHPSTAAPYHTALPIPELLMIPTPEFRSEFYNQILPLLETFMTNEYTNQIIRSIMSLNPMPGFVGLPIANEEDEVISGALNIQHREIKDLIEALPSHKMKAVWDEGMGLPTFGSKKKKRKEISPSIVFRGHGKTGHGDRVTTGIKFGNAKMETTTLPPIIQEAVLRAQRMNGEASTSIGHRFTVGSGSGAPRGKPP